jgi:hypothetical protein
MVQGPKRLCSIIIDQTEVKTRIFKGVTHTRNCAGSGRKAKYLDSPTGKRFAGLF